MDAHQLIKDLKRGKETAYSHLYEKYASLFYTICLRYSSNTQEAEDLTQEAFIKIAKNIDSFKNDGSFEGWMKRIVVNTCLNEYRSKKIQSTDLENLKAEDTNSMISSHENGLDLLSEEELLKMIMLLPDGFRTVFNLVIMEGYSHKEVADELNITESASRSQLTKARQKLQQMLIINDPLIYERNGR